MERPSDARLLTAREAADLLRASRTKLYRLVRSGDLTAYRIGATYVFYEGDLHAYIRQRATRPPEPASPTTG